MATWTDWLMGNSKFESLPKDIKDTAQWQRYQTSINTAETRVVVAKGRLQEARQAAEAWAAEQLEYAAETAKHEQLLVTGARNALQKGGRRRKRRRTKKRHRKRRKKNRRRHRRRRRR